MSFYEIFKDLRLGMNRKSISLSEHNASWSIVFEKLKSILRTSIQLELELHHIGSTSIPNMLAKPILDVLVVVNSVEEFDIHRSKLEAIGFVWKGEYGIANRRFCILYDEKVEIILIHLHVFAKSDQEIEKHLIFRDYLIASPSAATRYQELKLDLVKTGAVSSYSEGKSELIAQLLKEAYGWKNRNNLD